MSATSVSISQSLRSHVTRLSDLFSTPDASTDEINDEARALILDVKSFGELLGQKTSTAAVSVDHDAATSLSAYLADQFQHQHTQLCELMDKCMQSLLACDAASINATVRLVGDAIAMTLSLVECSLEVERKTIKSVKEAKEFVLLPRNYLFGGVAAVAAAAGGGGDGDGDGEATTTSTTTAATAAATTTTTSSSSSSSSSLSSAKPNHHHHKKKSNNSKDAAIVSTSASERAPTTTTTPPRAGDPSPFLYASAAEAVEKTQNTSNSNHQLQPLHLRRTKSLLESKTTTTTAAAAAAAAARSGGNDDDDGFCLAWYNELAQDELQADESFHPLTEVTYSRALCDYTPHAEDRRDELPLWRGARVKVIARLRSGWVRAETIDEKGTLYVGYCSSYMLDSITYARRYEGRELASVMNATRDDVELRRAAVARRRGRSETTPLPPASAIVATAASSSSPVAKFNALMRFKRNKKTGNGANNGGASQSNQCSLQ